ncbi:MAG: TetR family transcriptional regulator [Alphaproteobacteria bacterium]|nr:TetR family transcriptional regulator [Alphaproteobacteria bacterium]
MPESDPAAGPASDRPPADRAIDALMALTAAKGWRHVALADVAVEANLTLSALYALFRSKAAILGGFLRRVDEAAFAEREPGERRRGDGSVRDRLFDLLMRRFDALKPHRAALREIARAAPGDCALALCLGPRLFNAMRWTADAAGVETSGLIGPARVKVVTAAYLWAFRVFLTDESEDLAATMAALDKALARCEMLARSVPGSSRRSAAA